MFNLNVFITHWEKDVKTSIPKLLEVYQICLETGDLECGCWSLVVYCTNSYLIGKELRKLEREIGIDSKIVEKLKQHTALNYLKITHQVLLNLISKEDNFSSLVGKVYDEEKMLSSYQKAKDRTAIFSLYYHKLYLAYIFQEYEEALDYTVYAEQNLDGVRGQFVIPNFYFYDSLIKLALFSQNPQKYKHFLKKVTGNQKQMKQWADRAPMNYQHKYCLVQAELNRVKGNKEKAANLYESAISLAKKHEYIHEEALAYELAAKFYLEWDKATSAKAYMKEARYRYKLWGAKAKVKHLEQNYPGLLSSEKIGRADTNDLNTFSEKDTTRIKLDTLDLNTILETDRALSSEKDLEKLLAIVLKFAAKNVGAKIGIIIPAPTKNNLVKIAKITEDKEVIFLSSSEAIEEFPQSVIDYVKRTQETVILNNTSAEGSFTTDSYIVDRQVRSALCLPLLSQSNCVGVIYLENNLATDVFKKDGLKVLKVIANRGAVAIDNAILRKKKSYVSGYYQLGASLEANAPSYVEREADNELYQNLIEGNYCYLLNARQMGKSSLRVKIDDKLESLGYKCALVDLSSIPTEQVTRSEWYETFLSKLANNFPELDNPEVNNWLNNVSNLQPIRAFNYFFEQILLSKVKEEKIVIFLEEIDSIRNLDFSINDFFTQIRYFYNSRPDRPEFKRMTFVFIGAALPSQLIDDPKITPFNVGIKIELSGFKLEDTQPLIDGFKDKCDNPKNVMKEILSWTGGQPFLTQRVCDLVKSASDNVIPGKETEYITNLVETEIIKNWQRKDLTGHLKTIQKYILKNDLCPDRLLRLYKDIRLGKLIEFNPDEQQQEELLIIGIIKVENDRLVLFNRIYQSIFNLDWIEKHQVNFRGIC